MPFKLKGSPFYRNFGIGKAPAKTSAIPQLSPEEAKVVTSTQQAESTSAPVKAKFTFKDWIKKKTSKKRGEEGAWGLRDVLMPHTFISDYRKEKAYNETFGGRGVPEYEYSTKDSFIESLNPNAWGKYSGKTFKGEDYYKPATYDYNTGKWKQTDTQYLAGIKDAGMYWGSDNADTSTAQAGKAVINVNQPDFVKGPKTGKGGVNPYW